MALLILFSGFAAVILVGSILVAIHDTIEGCVVRRAAGASRGQRRAHVRGDRVVRSAPGLSSVG